MGRLVLFLGLVLLFVMAFAGMAMANPAAAPGAGDPTDVGNTHQAASTTEGGTTTDVPAPHGKGVENHFDFDPSDPLAHNAFHSVTNNPACNAHWVFGDHS